MKRIDYSTMFTRRKDGRYQTQYTGADGRQHYLYDRDPSRLFEKLADARTGKPVTYSELLDRWSAVHRPETEPGTWRNYVPHIADLKALYGSLSPSEVTPMLIKTDLERSKARCYSMTVVRTRRSLFSMSLSYAVLQGILPYNPAADVPLPKGLPHSHREAPTEDEIQTVISSVSVPFGLFAYFLLCTGLRKGEALALTWSDVDLDRRTVTVSKSIDYSESVTGRIKAPKTAAGYRTVPIPDALYPHLLALHDARTCDILFPAPPSNRGGSGGGYMTSRNFDGAWARYQQATGLTITAHQLRHGTATLLYECGADILYTQKLLGHASPQITQEIYTSLRDRQSAVSASAFNRSLSDKK